VAVASGPVPLVVPQLPKCSKTDPNSCCAPSSDDLVASYGGFEGLIPFRTGLSCVRALLLQIPAPLQRPCGRRRVDSASDSSTRSSLLLRELSDGVWQGVLKCWGVRSAGYVGPSNMNISCRVPPPSHTSPVLDTPPPLLFGASSRQQPQEPRCRSASLLGLEAQVRSSDPTHLALSMLHLTLLLP
jgi:hypothetical protein